MKKVYCCECEHYFNNGIEYCSALENMKDTYLRKNGGFIHSPREKNKMNDCLSFEVKVPVYQEYFIAKKESSLKRFWSWMRG